VSLGRGSMRRIIKQGWTECTGSRKGNKSAFILSILSIPVNFLLTFFSLRPWR
jgi:hypothetical protein